ncbi:MAG: hypothetical protein ACRCVV_18315, partial [Shewanella sp.]
MVIIFVRLACILLMAVTPMVYSADATVAIKIDVTNNDVSVSAQGVGASATYNQSTKIISFKDQFPEFDGVKIVDFGGRRGSIRRHNSLFTVELKGINYGHAITLKGKLTNTQFRGNTGAVAVGSSAKYVNNGCDAVHPEKHQRPNLYVFASTNLNTECSGESGTSVFAADTATSVTRLVGENREFILDLGGLGSGSQTAAKSLPPDTYMATTILSQTSWNGATSYRPNLNLQITLDKKPYFSGLQLADSQLTFNVKNSNADGGKVIGYVSTSFNFLGSFSKDDRVKINVASSNNFRLRSDLNSEIPYNMLLTYRD